METHSAHSHARDDGPSVSHAHSSVAGDLPSMPKLDSIFGDKTKSGDLENSPASRTRHDVVFERAVERESSGGVLKSLFQGIADHWRSLPLQDKILAGVWAGVGTAFALSGASVAFVDFGIAALYLSGTVAKWTGRKSGS